jgi:hypothetical protein
VYFDTNLTETLEEHAAYIFTHLAFSTLKMEAVGSSETSVNSYRTTRERIAVFTVVAEPARNLENAARC